MSLATALADLAAARAALEAIDAARDTALRDAVAAMNSDAGQDGPVATAIASLRAAKAAVLTEPAQVAAMRTAMVEIRTARRAGR